MSAEFESLWVALRERLQARGELPLRHEVLTPAEIAAAVRKETGDPRAWRFVWEYYYPRYYGHESGAMSDADAAALVASYDTQSPEGTTPGGALGGDAAPGRNEPRKPPCQVCHRRSAQGGQPGSRKRADG